MKKVLIVADQPGWIFERHALEIQKRCKEFAVDIAFHRQNIVQMQKDYDCIYIMDPMPLKYGYPDVSKVILGLRCEFLYREHPRGAKGLFYEGFPGRCVSIDDKCSLFHVVNKNQFRIFSEFVNKPLLLAQHGIDESLFYDDGNNFNHKEFTVGISGRASANKGFDIVQKVCNEKGYKFVTASYGSHKLSKEEMPNFYRGLDVFVCMSLTEGLHNPTLEAGGCGIPIITTKCGAAEEIIVDGHNGFIINRDSLSLGNALEKLKEHNTRRTIGKRIADDIKGKWTWGIRINDFRNMFCKMLGDI